MIQYIGKIPVRLYGVRGEIQPGSSLTLPDKIASNLLLDKENWKKGEEKPVESPLPEVRETPVEESPGAGSTTEETTTPGESSAGEPPVDKKKRKKEVI